MVRVNLFYCEEYEEVARCVAAVAPGVELKPILWRAFQDKFPNLFIPDAADIEGQHVAFLASLSSPTAVFEQVSIMYDLPLLSTASLTVVLPFFPTGTSSEQPMDNNTGGVVSAAFTLCRMLSNIPPGPTTVVIFDVLEELFCLGDRMPLPRLLSAMPLLKDRLDQLPDRAKVSIAFPDEVAWKRFHVHFQHFPMIRCTKVMDGDKQVIRIKDGEAAGRHVVIVDAVARSGRTLKGCQEVLLANDASQVSAFVTHGAFAQGGAWEQFLQRGGEVGFSYFWLTDSCPPTAQAVQGKPPFEVLSIAGLIARALSQLP